MSALVQDLRFGLRMLVKTPVVSIIAALSLALGITGATAMFALASGFFLEPLPFGDQDGLAMVQQLQHGEAVEMASGVSMPNFRDLQEASTVFTGLTAFTVGSVNLTGLDQPEQIQLATGTPNLFEILGIRPWMGRGFRPDEGVEGRRNVIVLDYAYWESQFLSDPHVLGRAVTLDGIQHTVIGVMPERFEMLPVVQGFRPSDFSGVDERGSRAFLVFGRLRPGATLEQARSELAGISARLEAEFPDSNRGWGLFVQAAREWFPGPTDTKLIMLLIVVAIFGLAIAGANVANLLLGRAEIRMKEVAVRTALGAGKARILRQLLTESVLMGLAAAAIGTLLALYVIRGLQTAMPPQLPRAFWPTLDVPTLAATVMVAVATGILFGLAPAIHSTGGNLRESLGDGSRGGTASRSRKRIRNLFVMGEVALALAMLTGSSFLIKAMDTLVRGDPGFNAEGLLTFELTLPEHRYPEPADLVRFEDEALRVLAEIPGARSVTLMASLPRSQGNPTTSFLVEGSPEVEESERSRTGWQAVSPAYLETLEVPLRSGRFLEESDRADTRPVVVVNQEFARRHFPDGDVLGRRLQILGESREIVGVAGNVLQSRIPFDGRIDAAVYLPVAQRSLRNPAFALRVDGDPTALAADARAAVWSVDPDQPIALTRTLEDHIAESMAGPRVLGVFVLCLGILAMVLAAIGIYGVMAHSVIQGTREIGVRMAMGAREGQIVGMMTRQGFSLTGIGLLLGVPIAFLVYRAVINALNLFDVSLGFNYALAAAAMLIAVAVLASYIPARRAARIEPVRALQGE
jgi:putative ABC transport system permease protein